jgi:Tfp pilus assembly protein PilN
MDKGGLYIGAGHVVGVAVQATAAGAVVYTYAYLQRKGEQILLRGTGEAGSIEALLKDIGTRVPIALCLDTPRCVHRVLHSTGAPEDLVAQAFPNAPLTDLRVGQWRMGQGTGLSMVRASEVQQVLEELVGKGARAVSLHIGPWPLLGMLPLLGDLPAERTFGQHRFLFEEGALTAVERTTEPGPSELHIGEDRVPGAHALAFATAWAHLVPSADQHVTSDELVADGQRQEKARRWYEGWMLVALATLLILLTGEQLLSHSLNDRRHLLEGSGADRAALARQIAEEQAVLAERTALAQRLGLDTARRSAVFAAELAATVPEGIRLERLAVDPLSGTLKEREPAAFEHGKVLLRGTCSTTAVLNTWMDTLRRHAPGRTVRLLGYSTDVQHPEPVFEISLEP